MHRFQKHVLWIVLVGAVGLAMTGFGVNLYSNRSSPEVASVNGVKITGEQLLVEMRGIENQYRQIFGDRASELMKSFGVNVESQAIDQLVDKTLWNQESASYGLIAPEQEVERIVRDQLAAAQFDAGRFRAFLSQVGLTEEAFLKELGSELQRTAIQRAVADALTPARLEVSRKHARDNAKVSAVVATISKDVLAPSTYQVSEEEVEQYYASHETEFFVPGASGFSFVALTPEMVAREVPVSAEEIENYYSERQGEFVTPAQATYAALSFAVPANADAVAIAKVQEQAQKALAEARKGATLEALAKKFKATVVKVTTASKSASETDPLRKMVFELTAPGFSELASSATTIAFAQVQKIIPQRQQGLAEVTAKIESTLRNREAPAFAATKAQDLFARWQEQLQLSLTAFGQAEKLSVQQHAIGAELPFTKALQELSEGVAVGARKLIEDGNAYLLVEVTARKEGALRPLAEVRQSISDKLKQERIDAALQGKARELITALRAESLNPDKWNDLIKQAKVPVQTKGGLSKGAKENGADGVFADQQVQEFLFEDPRRGAVASNPLMVGGQLVVVGISDVATSADAPKAAEISAVTNKLVTDGARLAQDALLAERKAQAKISISRS